MAARFKSFFLQATAVLVASAQAGAAGAPVLAQAADDPVLLSFAVTGDMRLDPTRPKASANALPPALLKEFNKPGGANDPYPFYFNLVQVRQTLADLAGMPVMPNYLFLTGDLVMGFARDNKDLTLDKQLVDFAVALTPPGLKTPPVVLMPGNHEMTFKEYDTQTKITTTGEDNADNTAWNTWVTKNGYDQFGGNGPHMNALEGLAKGGKLRYDQSKLTYSFNGGPGGSVHFIVMNTDTDTTEMTDEGLGTEGLIPLTWVLNDLAQAQKTASVKHIFVLGHRPIKFPVVQGAPKAGKDDTLNEEVAEPLRRALVANDKVRALLCSHVHLFHADSLADSAPAGDATTRPVQIIAGNGGMNPESYWTPDGGPFYGFTMIEVHQSGQVTYNSWQRPVPTPYYGQYPDDKTASAKASQSVTIK